MTSSTAPNGVDEELAQLRLAIVALDAKLAPAAPTRPAGGGDAAFKIFAARRRFEELRASAQEGKQMIAKDALAAAVTALREALAALEKEPPYHSRLGHLSHYRHSLRAQISSLEHMISELGK